MAARARAGAERAQVREFLEKHYEEAAGTAAVKLAIRALMETVEASSKSIEIAVMEREAGENTTPLIQCRGTLRPCPLQGCSEGGPCRCFLECQ